MSKIKHSFFFRLSLSCLSGILLSFAFPPFGLWQLAFISLVPLLISAKEDSLSNFLLGVTTGLVFYSFSLFWLYKLAGFLYLLLALYLSIYWGIFLYILYKLPSKGRIFLGAFIWFFLEIIVSNLITGFPWLLLGLSQFQSPYPKISGFFGIYGISFLLILANLTISHLGKKKHFLSVLVSISIFIVISFVPLEKFHKISSKGEIDVMLIQPNILSEENRSSEETLSLLIKLTKDNIPKIKPALIIWPEGSFSDTIEDYPHLIKEVKLLTEEHFLSVIMGTFTKADIGIYNSALKVKGENLELYNKNHLVPYGEFILGDKCIYIRRAFQKVAGYTPTVVPGDKLQLFNLDGKYVAPLICFENVFPEMTMKYNNLGAEIFVVITNDSWFGKSAGPYQHFAHNVMRAAESGKYFIQASLTGVSGVISPEGKIIETIESGGNKIFVPGTLSFKVPLREGKTFYSQFGDLPLFLLSIFFIGAIICRNTKN